MSAVLGPIFVQIVLPTVAMVLSGLVGLLITKAERLLHINADAAANQVIQNAVSNFAGKIVLELHSGRLTLHEVLAGQSNEALRQYAEATVKDSINRLGVTPEVLATMLVGKVGQVIGGAPVGKPAA